MLVRSRSFISLAPWHTLRHRRLTVLLLPPHRSRSHRRSSAARIQPPLLSFCVRSRPVSPLRVPFVRAHSRAPSPSSLLHLAFMAAGGPRRRSWIRRRRGGSKLGGHGGGNDNLFVKPGNHNCGDWICVRGRRIRRRGRMRIDANGDVYVPDSEDEGSYIEVGEGAIEVPSLVDASVAANVVQMAVVGVPADATTVEADGVVRNDVDLAAEGVSADAVEVGAEVGGAGGIKVAADTTAGEEMHPEVAVRLKKLLAHVDPTFCDVFVSMYKLRSINIEIYFMHNNLCIFLEKMGSFLEPMDLITF